MSEDQADINQDVGYGSKLVRFLDGPKKGESVRIPVDRRSIVVMKLVNSFDQRTGQYEDSVQCEKFVYKTVDIGGCCFAYCEGEDRLRFFIASALIDWLARTSKNEPERAKGLA